MLATVLGVPFTTAGQTQSDPKRNAIQNMYYEAATCVAFYTTVSFYSSRDPSAQAAAVAEQDKHGALDMITMVQKLVAELGAKEEGGNATIRMFADDMKKVVANNVDNLSILTDKCKTLHDTPQVRSGIVRKRTNADATELSALCQKRP
ncbi:MAG: hypothetical protein WCD56_07650 [Pseudolabrys sp.]